MERLNREDLKKLKSLCKQKNYDAVVALLDYTIADGIERLIGTTVDHRYSQGAVTVLRDFRDDIVQQLK